MMAWAFALPSEQAPCLLCPISVLDAMAAHSLKPRTMQGFKSEGMVLCASNADHTEVKFVEVPAGASPGERVAFPGRPESEPAIPNQVQKKKLWEKCQPHFRTGADDGVARCGDIPFTLAAGVCSAPLKNAAIS